MNEKFYAVDWMGDLENISDGPEWDEVTGIDLIVRDIDNVVVRGSKEAIQKVLDSNQYAGWEIGDVVVDGTHIGAGGNETVFQDGKIIS